MKTRRKKGREKQKKKETEEDDDKVSGSEGVRPRSKAAEGEGGRRRPSLNIKASGTSGAPPFTVN